MTAAVDEADAREAAAGLDAREGRAGGGNVVLAALIPDDLALLAPHLTRASFAVGDVVARAGEPIETVCFLENGVAGVIDALGSERRYAVGLVGAEGYVGWPLLLGETRSPWDVVMRAECGRALLLHASILRQATEANPRLHAALLRFVQAMMAQISKSCVSALAHPVDRRMARWILMYDDRLRDADIQMTHEEFRLMLGVRRSSVTDALLRLQDDGAIRATRGRVAVRDRARLMLLAGDTYLPPAPDRESQSLQAT